MTLVSALRTGRRGRRYNTRSRRSVRWDLDGIQTIEPSPTHEDPNEDGGNGAVRDAVEDTSNFLKLATLNIIEGRRNRLNAAIRCMSQMNVDIAVLTESSFDRYQSESGLVEARLIPLPLGASVVSLK